MEGFSWLNAHQRTDCRKLSHVMTSQITTVIIAPRVQENFVCQITIVMITPQIGSFGTHFEVQTLIIHVQYFLLTACITPQIRTHTGWRGDRWACYAKACNTSFWRKDPGKSYLAQGFLMYLCVCTCGNVCFCDILLLGVQNLDYVHFMYSTRANISIMSRILTTKLFQDWNS